MPIMDTEATEGVRSKRRPSELAYWNFEEAEIEEIPSCSDRLDRKTISQMTALTVNRSVKTEFNRSLTDDGPSYYTLLVSKSDKV